MLESIMFFVVMAALSYGLYIRGRAKRSAAIINLGDSIDYTLTLWAERAVEDVDMDMENGQKEVRLQRISAEYAITMVFAEEEEMREVRTAYAQSAREDFQRHFEPLLGQINIGAVRFDPANGEI